jgi:hypothetical protein
MAVVGDVTMYRGEDLTIDLDLPDPATDATGWATLMTVKAKPGDSVALFTVPGTVNDAHNITFVLAAALTVGLAPGPYEYDMWRTSPGNSELRRGRLNILQRVYLP